ncbi:unnamed protein product [Caenorhabditis angaria]|uniref:Tyrosine-protein kinase n=1 Tax=Caenorhabditis angaria TaxID=860376 RepID=A0A9P1I3L6_9PELO|nr:unnamed protein product [Caenorhabditis angaria]
MTSTPTPSKNEKQENVFLTEKNDLTKLKFYHGVQTKEDAQKILKDFPIGYYLIRSSFLKNEVRLVLFLSVKVTDKDLNAHHYLIESKGSDFVIHQEVVDENAEKKTVVSPPFKDYDEMAKYFRLHRMASGIRLCRPVYRPKWQLRHSEVNYEDAGKLGSGNFCHVYRGKLTRSSTKEEDVAIKVSKTTENDSAALMETRNALLAEAKIMITYNHSNVIKLFGIACDHPPFMVCMEFCIGGSLESALLKYGNEMEEFERQTLLIDAARGMRYLHAQKCVHRDLASRNCLISSDGFVKIADFGLSKTLGANETVFKEALKEAPLVWMAPECVQKESEFSIKSDVWAFGVLIYEVYFNGLKPFADEKDTGIVVKAIRRAKMPLIEEKTKEPKMNHVLSSIWIRKPEERADFQKVLELLVDALVVANMADVKKMQINKLDGVNRKKLPNIETDKADEIAMAFSYNEANDSGRNSRKREKTSRRKSKRRGENTAKTETRATRTPQTSNTKIRKSPTT